MRTIEVTLDRSASWQAQVRRLRNLVVGDEEGGAVQWEGPHNQNPNPRRNATPLAPRRSGPERGGAGHYAPLRPAPVRSGPLRLASPWSERSGPLRRESADSTLPPTEKR